MNKLLFLIIDYSLCGIFGAISGAYIILNWKIGVMFLLITILFHIWRWNNLDKMYNAFVLKGVKE